jgi:hypothetical protein
MRDWKWDKKERQRQDRQQSIVQKLRAKNAVASASAIEQHLTESERAGAQALLSNSDAQLLNEFRNLADELLQDTMARMLPPPIVFPVLSPLRMFGMWEDEMTPPPQPPPLPEETVVAAIEGYRCWCVPMFRDELRSMNGAAWPTYRRMESDCPNGACSGVNCGCGLHAFKKMELAKGEFEEKNSRYTNRVFGSVWLWGRVLECEKGYRAQFAYPKSFTDTGTLARKMAVVYGVKVA